MSVILDQAKTQKAHKGKSGKLNHSKIKNICYSKTPLSKWKCKPEAM